MIITRFHSAVKPHNLSYCNIASPTILIHEYNDELLKKVNCFNYEPLTKVLSLLYRLSRSSYWLFHIRKQIGIFKENKQSIF